MQKHIVNATQVDGLVDNGSNNTLYLHDLLISAVSLLLLLS